MDDSKIETIRQNLLRLKAELQALEESSKATTQVVELDQASVGRLSRVDAMQAQQVALETARRRQQQIVAIESALRRIESGEYGVCSVCSEEIDVRRLFVAPTSTRCVGCADK